MAASTQEMALIVRAHNQASRVLNTVGRDLDQLHRKQGTITKGLKSMGKIAGLAALGLGVAVAAGVAVSIGAYAKFDEKMTGSLAIMGDVSDEMKTKMEDTAREIGKTTLIGANEAAEAYFFLASAGLDAAASIEALPLVAQFAQAGMFDMSLATDLLTDAQSALGLVMEDPIENLANMARISDVLVKANTLANASVEQFATSLTNKAAVALKMVNKDVEEGVAVLAVFADQGVKGQIAGDMFSRVLKGLQINADKNTEAFAKYNVTVFDSQGNMRNMADIADDLTGAFEGLSDQQKTSALLELGFSARQQDAIKLLIGNADAMRDYETALRDAGGTTGEIADKQLESINAQWTLFKGKIKDVFIGIGKGLGPAIKGLLKKLGELAEKWGPRVGKFFDKVIKVWVPKVVKAFKKVGDMIGGVIAWFKDLSPEIKSAMKVGGILVGVVAGLSVAFGILTGILGALFSPVVLVVAAIFAIGFAVKLAWDRFEIFREVVGAVVEWFMGTAVPFLKEAWQAILEAVQVAWKFIKKAIEVGVAFVQDLWDRFGAQIIEVFKTAWDAIVAYYKFIWKILKGIVKTAIAIVIFIWENFGEHIWNFIKGIWEAIKTVIEGALDIIIGVFKFFKGIFTLDWDLMWEGIKGILSGAWTIIQGIVEAAWVLLKSAFEVGWTAIKLFFEGAWNVFTSLWDTGWATLGGAVEALWDGVVGVFQGAINGVLGVLEAGINAGIRLINTAIRAYNSIPLAPDIALISEVSLGRLGGGASSGAAKELPKFAHGGTMLRAGLALVGEEGPELLRLARGDTVTPLSGGGGVTFGDINVVTAADPNEIAGAIAWRLRTVGI